MTKKSNASKAKSVARRPKRMGRPTTAPQSEHVKYKKLLLDPCNAEIPATPYGDDVGTIIQRNHWVLNNPRDPFLLFWHPWYGLFVSNANTIVPQNIGQANVTGTGRSLAGCVGATYSGAETSRAGMIQCGIVPGAIVEYYMPVAQGGKGAALDLADVANFIPNLERTPVDRCSVNWFPGQADEAFMPPLTFDAASYSAIATTFAKTHFVAIFVTGQGANNIRFNFTPVNEVVSLATGAVASGSSAPVWTLSSKSGPSVDVKQVIRELTKQDSTWYLNTFRKLANFGVGLGGAYMTAGLPGALGYLTKEFSGGYEVGGKKQQYVRAGGG